MATSWITGYPLITAYNGTTATASGAINNSGLGWFVVVPSGASAPSSVQVVAGQDAASGSVAAGFSGSGTFAASGTAAGFTATGLVSETNYAMYLVASGIGDTLQANPTGLYFATTDITAPSWTTNPTITSITTSTAVVNMNLNDAGSGYVVILPATNTNYPSASQIRAGTDGLGTSAGAGLYGSTALSSGVAATINITNLHYSTNYCAYATARDDGGNDTAAVVCGAFRAAVPNPGAVAGRYTMRRVVNERRRRENMIRRALGM